MLPAILQSANYKYWAFFAIAIGIFISVVDQGSVNIAAPTIAEYFDTDIPTIQWVAIAYALTISALLLPMGRLADLVGRKKVYISGSLLFVIGAALAGSAVNLPHLFAARVLQGIGGAMTQGTGMAIITSVFPGQERGKSIGLIMTTVGTGAIAGPAIGGLLVGGIDWRAVFFFGVPLMLIGTIACFAILDDRRAVQVTQGPREGNFDWMGAALSSGMLIVLMLALTTGHRSGWYSPPILTALVGFVALLGAFIWWELRVSNPMLDVRLFARRTFSLGVSANFLAFLGSSAVLFLTPFYLQKVLGFSPSEAGLMTMPGALCMALMGPISGRFSDRYGWRRFTVGGLVLSVSGMLILSRLSENSPVIMVIGGLVLQNSGMGLFYSPNSSSILSAVERERYGVISAFVNLIRNSANVTSIAIATAIVTATMGYMGFEPSLEAVSSGDGGGGVISAFVSGLGNAYLAMLGLLVVGLAVSTFKGERLRERVPEVETGTGTG